MHKPPQPKVGQTEASLLRYSPVYNIIKDCVLDLVNMNGKTCYLNTCVSIVLLRTIE